MKRNSIFTGFIVLAVFLTSGLGQHSAGLCDGDRTLSLLITGFKHSCTSAHTAAWELNLKAAAETLQLKLLMGLLYTSFFIMSDLPCVWFYQGIALHSSSAH